MTELPDVPSELVSRLLAPDPDVRTYVHSHSNEFVESLVQWVSIPSISADPAFAPDVRRSAEWLAVQLREAGFPTVEVWETADGTGHPAVFAEWPAADAGAPTVVVYGHHDVQPVEPADAWTRAPFAPTVVDDRLYGRGAADDKGQVLLHLLGLRAHLAATGRDAPQVNLKLLVEGEEESGSANLRALLRKNRERLACDYVVVSDTSIWSRELPTTVTGMRGLMNCEVTLQGPASDIHSGSFGGAVPNPLHVLCRALGKLHDEQGRVTVPQFYEDVEPLSERDRRHFAELPFDEEAWLNDAQSHAVAGESGYSTLERLWARPAAEINGLWGGHTGPGPKTIVPARAHAKISFRLVASQDPARIEASFRTWLASQVPAGIHAEVEFHGPGVRACLTSSEHPAVEAVTQALSRAFERPAVCTREGASGPAADLHEALAAPVLFLGVSLPDDGWHAPNEKVEIPLLLLGAEAAAYLWAELAALSP